MSELYTRSYDDGLRKYISSIFSIMGLGLVITAATSYYCFMNILSGGLVFKFLVNVPMASLIILFVQLGIVIFLTSRINHISAANARVLFLLYCVITGITFGTLPLLYGIANIFMAFIFAAVMFGCCAVIGYTTKVDMTRFSGLLIGGLFSLVIMSIVGLIFRWSMDSMFICMFGIVIFLGLTAYDMQMIKRNYYMIYDNEMAKKYRVISALNLYLDFINIFLYVLRFLGKRNK